MRTATTRKAEVLAFEKLPSISIIIGATKVLYRRHAEGLNLILCGLIALGVGFVLGLGV